MNIVKMATSKQSENDLQHEMYRSLMDDFFARNYPAVDPDHFWNWFLTSLTGKNLNIDFLSSNDINLFLNELNKVGDNLFQSADFKNINL